MGVRFIGLEISTQSRDKLATIARDRLLLRLVLMSRALTVAVVASLLGHGLLVALLASRAGPAEPPAPTPSSAVNLDFTVEVHPFPPELREVAAAPVKRAGTEQKVRIGAVSGLATEQAKASHRQQESKHVRASAEPELPRASQPAMDLSPSAVARAELGDLPVPMPTARPDGPGSPIDNQPMTGERLDQYLAEATRNSAISRSPDPELVRRSDGSYFFEGNSIKAVIDPDGQVHFEDVFRRGNSFDLMGYIERKRGGSPFRSEQRWFMERTAELRERLAQSTLRLLATLQGPELVAVLSRIWSDPGLPDSRRKQETLRLWVAAGASEQRRSSREQIEAFVRARCPETSLCAFKAAELASFNRDRRVNDRFEPYAAR